MERLYNFINDNRKLLIIIIISILVLLAVWIFVIPCLNKKEHLENINGNDLRSMVDKNVYITCQLKEKDSDKTNMFYLGISAKKDCHNLKDIKVGECGLNIPILQKQKNRFALFEISKHPSQDMYGLRSTMSSLNMPYLTQNLNYYKNINYLCFDNNIDDDIIFFETEEINTGTLLKFRKKIAGAYKYFYVGACNDLGLTCEQGPNTYTRLCLYGDPANALAFKFEVAPKEVQSKDMDEIYKEVIEMEHEPIRKEKKEELKMMPASAQGMQMEGEDEHKIETFGDLSSLYSLQTGVSYDSMMGSLPGIDYTNNLFEL